MKSFIFENRLSIQATAAEIYTYLMEPLNLTRLHPLIVGVNLISSDKPGTSRVEIQDKIMLLGLIPVYKKYEASFTGIEQDRQLLLETFTSPGIHIQNTITVQEEDERTEVRERVLIDVPAWVAGFVMRQIRFSHGEMLQTLKKTLEHKG
jgi:ligand-binding SRPBCC domain-containing protein